MEMILDIVVYALILFAIVRVVTFLGNKHLEQEVNTIRAEAKKLADITHLVSEEKYGDIIYWFDSTDRFLAQGKTVEEIIEVLKQRFPKHIFFLSDQTALYAPDWKPVSFKEQIEILEKELDK